MADRRLGALVRNPKVVTGAKIVFGVGVVTFGVIYVASRWDEVGVQLRIADTRWLVLAAVFAGLGLLSAMVGTREALEATSGRRLPLPAAARVFFVSQLGKYIPGSVWSIVAVTAMTGRYGIKPTESASAGVLSMFLSVVTGGSLGALLVLAAGDVPGGLWWLLLLVPVAVLLGWPKVVFGVLGVALRLVKRPALAGLPPARVYGAAVAATAVGWVFLGLQCWALCVAVGAGPGESLLGAAGGFALAYTAGTLFVPAPAGAGVREAVLGFALADTVTGATRFTSGSVVAVVLLSRVLLALLDFGLAGVAVLVHARTEASARKSRPAAPALGER